MQKQTKYERTEGKDFITIQNVIFVRLAVPCGAVLRLPVCAQTFLYVSEQLMNRYAKEKINGICLNESRSMCFHCADRHTNSKTNPKTEMRSEF